jgi:AraC-like DNA-binding protein
MPIEMPKESLITIQKRTLSADFMMPQMEIAAGHFSIGYLISGDRRIITPYRQIDQHEGNMVTMAPMIYHRSFPLSDKPYVNYLVKISQTLADDFCREVDPKIWQDVFEPRCITFSPGDREKVQNLLADLLELYENRTGYTDVLLRGMLYRLVVLIWEKSIRNDSHRFKDALSKEIMEVMYYIEQNYADDIRLKDAALAAGFSEGHLSRLFVSQVGVPFSEYLINVRIRHVKELLLNTDLSVSEIAFHTGFSNADYLSACFRRREGMTPTAFRKGTAAA